ncbi:MAG: response regulator, partial [Candidatus Hydrothermarchaeales archaeon]
MSDNLIKVLLIEDNQGDARLIEEMLKEAERASFELVVADSLSRGLEFMTNGNIDVLLLDLGLPDSQGFDTFSRVRSQTPHLPVIILTGLDDEEMGVNTVANGAQDYLVKGMVDSNLLVRTVRYAIERKRAEEELKKRYNMLQEEHEQLKAKVDDLKFTEQTKKIKSELSDEDKKIIDELGNSTLVKYTAKEELTKFVEKIIDSFHKNGNPIIFITPQPRSVQRYKRVTEILKEGAIQIIDMPSGWAAETNPSPYIKLPMSHLYLFGDLIRKMPSNSVLILEPVSQLILTRGFEIAYQFLYKYSEELSNREITFIAFLNSSAHTPEEIGGIENIFLKT